VAFGVERRNEIVAPFPASVPELIIPRQLQPHIDRQQRSAFISVQHLVAWDVPALIAVKAALAGFTKTDVEDTKAKE
jgi:hypothetical protein